MPYTYQYPHAALSADCCVFGFDGSELQILLIQRREDPHKGQWAFPGGFLRMDETIEECALRELESETHLTPQFLEQFHVFSSVDRDPRERVVTVAFLALVPISEVRGGDDAARARWYPVDRIPYLAFDHQLIFQAARQALKERLQFENLAYCLLDSKFTSQQLQHLYETVLGDSVDKNKLIRKMLSSNVVYETGERSEEVLPNNSRKLYSFVANSFAKVGGSR